MLDLLRDIGLAFCPESVRAVHRPHSSLRVLRAATVTGALQAAVCSGWLVAGWIAFLSLRNQQYGDVLRRRKQVVQAGAAAVFSFEYLFHPLTLFLLYMAVEGVIRFAGGLCVSEAVPSLPVVLAFGAKTHFERRKAQRVLQALAAIPDSLEVLADGERLRIAASLAKAKWNASMIIGIQGEWYEVEREEKGTPRPYVYVLRRAPVRVGRGRTVPHTPSRYNEAPGLQGLRRIHGGGATRPQVWTGHLPGRRSEGSFDSPSSTRSKRIWAQLPFSMRTSRGSS